MSSFLIVCKEIIKIQRIVSLSVKQGKQVDKKERTLGGLLGVAVGDALGVPVELFLGRSCAQYPSPG